MVYKCSDDDDELTRVRSVYILLSDASTEVVVAAMIRMTVY